MDSESPDDEWDDEDEVDELPCLIDCDECGRVMEPILFDPGDDPLITVVTDPSRRRCIRRRPSATASER